MHVPWELSSHTTSLHFCQWNTDVNTLGHCPGTDRMLHSNHWPNLSPLAIWHNDADEIEHFIDPPYIYLLWNNGWACAKNTEKNESKHFSWSWYIECLFLILDKNSVRSESFTRINVFQHYRFLRTKRINRHINVIMLQGNAFLNYPENNFV